MYQTNKYYEHSGAIGLMGLIYMIIFGAVGTLVLGPIYGYAIFYIPYKYLFIFLHFFITLVFGFCVACLVGIGGNVGKVRNSKVYLLFGFIFGFFAEYVGWVSWIFVFSKQETLVLTPSSILNVIQIVSENGVWSHFGRTPTGTVLYIIWGIEAIMIIGMSTIGAWLVLGHTPFCERCNKWIEEEDSISPLEPVNNPDELKSQLEKGDYALLKSLTKKKTETDAYTKINLLHCPGCQQNYFLTIKSVVVSVGSKNKVKRVEKIIIENLIITSEHYRMIKEQRYQFRKVCWGMSQKEVRASEESEVLWEDQDILKYAVEFAGKQANLVYSFSDDVLVSAYYQPIAEHEDETLFFQDYKDFHSELTNKYGEPFQDKTIWRQDTYKNDRSKWGLAVKEGHLHYYATWNVGETTIGIDLRGGANSQIYCLINYYSNELYNFGDAGGSPRLDLKNNLERFIECNNRLLDMDNADELVAILTSMEINQPAYSTCSKEELYVLIMASIVFIHLNRNINDFDSTKKYLDEIKVHAERMEKTLQDHLFMVEYHILMMMYLIQTGEMENALQELKIYEQKTSSLNIPEDREYALSMKGCINNNKLDEARNLFQKRMVNLFDLQLGYITDRWEDTDKLREKLKDEYGL